MRSPWGRSVGLLSPARAALAAGLALVGPDGARMAAAQDITASKDGYLTFTNANPALYYRVEFKPNLTGAEAWDGAYEGLKNIRTNAATVTVPVGVHYRVVGSAAPVGIGTAVARDILAPQTVFVSGKEVTGTLPNVGAQYVTPGVTNRAIAAGYHNGAGRVAGDANLVTANIQAKAKLFGVTGKQEVVDTGSGDAIATHLRVGQKAWVDGVEVQGTLATRTISPDTDEVARGYYEETTLSAADPDLATGNIRAGVTLFGVTGKTAVVDTTSGDAASKNLAAGKKAWVDGREITGTEAQLSAYLARVPKSGAGAIAGYPAVAGEDGDPAMRRGVASPSPRFTDHGNGTVTDNLTGLIWLQNASAFGLRDWATSLSDCANLNSGEAGLTDGSVAGDWRLPNVKELRSLIDFGRYAPAVPAGHPFSGVRSGFGEHYWSGTTDDGGVGRAWSEDLRAGTVQTIDKPSACYVWPVRGGT